MKLLSITLYFCLSNFFIFSQPPIVQWEKGYGGSDFDEGMSIIQQTNGHFLICGTTNSNDHDLVGVHYSVDDDLWYLNLNSFGNPVSWKCYGGTWFDEGRSVSFKNNQVILFGIAGSEDGDLTGIHSMTTGPDLWLLKIDSTLNISFQKTFGSTGGDEAKKIMYTNDGGFIFLAKIGMAGNDVDTSYGHDDIWVAKTDSMVNIIWETTFGSISGDRAGDIITTQDGGYLVVGGAAMNNGNVACTPFSGTIWLIKLDSNGVVEWQKCFSSAYARKVIATNDGGFVVAGLTFDSTIAGYSGYSDYLLFKIDSLGNEQWTHCYGGSQFDTPNDLIQCSDGGFLVAGTSDSYDFYASTSHGAKEALLVKIDSLGNYQWSQCYGNYGDETCTSITETSDGGFVLTGSTSSWNGLPNYGHGELWVLKINYSGNGIFTPDNSIEQFHSYASTEGIGIELSSKKEQDILISIYDISGRKLLSDNTHVVIGKSRLNYSLEVANGVFLIQLNCKDGRVVNKLVK